MKISNLLQEIYSRQNSDFKRHIEGAWGVHSHHTNKETPEQIAAYLASYNYEYIQDATGLGEDVFEWGCKDESGKAADWFNETIVPEIMEDEDAPQEDDYDDEQDYEDAKYKYVDGYDESRTIELINEYLKDNPEEFSDDSRSETQSFVQFFLKKYHEQAEYNGYMLQTKVHSKHAFYGSPERIKRDTWLVHFTEPENIKSILDAGFIHGVADKNALGITDAGNSWGESKAKGGYNFAFDSSDGGEISSHAGGTGYLSGSDIIMFQNSGTALNHMGDAERQIIFWGKDVDPRTMVWLKNNEDEDTFSVMTRNGRPMYSGAVMDCIEWVKDNFQQYRRQLTTR